MKFVGGIYFELSSDTCKNSMLALTTSVNFLFLDLPFHNCSNVTVPNNMFCYEDENETYVIDCPRTCPVDECEDKVSTVCSSELGTYSSACDMSQKVCEFYARKHLDVGDMDNATKVLENITISDYTACDRK